MRITEVTENKRRHMDLLLLADEQEDMVERYLDRGTMYLLEDRGARAVCVVTDEGTAFWRSRTWPSRRTASGEGTADSWCGLCGSGTPASTGCCRWAPARAR